MLIWVMMMGQKINWIKVKLKNEIMKKLMTMLTNKKLLNLKNIERIS